MTTPHTPRPQRRYLPIEDGAAAMMLQEQPWRLYGDITPGTQILGFGNLFSVWVRLAIRRNEKATVR